jgi:hypothetical protein
LKCFIKDGKGGFLVLRNARTCLSFLPVRSTSDGLGESITYMLSVNEDENETENKAAQHRVLLGPEGRLRAGSSSQSGKWGLKRGVGT